MRQILKGYTVAELDGQTVMTEVANAHCTPAPLSSVIPKS